MVDYSKVNVKLSNSQLNNLKTAAKNQTIVTLRMNVKMLNGDSLPHKLLLITRQKTNLRNAFEKNMSTDIKLAKTWISKIYQSGGFLGLLFSKIAGPLMKVAVPLGKKYFSSFKNYNCCFSNWSRNSKKKHAFGKPP